MKKLSELAIIELEIERKFSGKVWVYTPAAFHEGGIVQLGIAVANEKGYHPIPLFWCHAEDWDELDNHAEELNLARGFEPEAAWRIVASTMRGN